LIAERLIKL